ncbi:hypothetical protein [Novosphingobium soli]|uniref:XRE family transcriptional regulator n=1 Tax=Novosphingobium soli TaxID=574956 RepID=A0ABV6CVF1_9SPHN
MASNSASQQDLADRLSEVLRKLSRDGVDLHVLARKVGEERRDLLRWAGGTTMPAHVLVALLDELPRHHADYLIGATQLRLVARDEAPNLCAMKAAAATASFAAEVAQRMADGSWCHRDDAESKEDARETITVLQQYVGD